MIEQLDDMPPGTIGFRSSGRVTRDDYRTVLMPPMRAAAEVGEVRIVYVIDADFERFEPGALAEDTKAGVILGLGHHSAWKRCALVTDHEWLLKAFHATAWMAPGELKTFGLDELEEAKQWVAG